MEERQIPAPDWISKPPSEWPAAARSAYDLLATLAERRKAMQQATKTPSTPGAA